jgi:hypothetical protein
MTQKGRYDIEKKQSHLGSWKYSWVRKNGGRFMTVREATRAAAEANHRENLPSPPKRDGPNIEAGHVTTRCRRCGKVLTDPASVQAGYGPVCRRAGP